LGPRRFADLKVARSSRAGRARDSRGTPVPCGRGALPWGDRKPPICSPSAANLRRGQPRHTAAPDTADGTPAAPTPARPGGWGGRRNRQSQLREAKRQEPAICCGEKRVRRWARWTKAGLPARCGEPLNKCARMWQLPVGPTVIGRQSRGLFSRRMRRAL